MEGAFPRFAVLIPRKPVLPAWNTIKLLTGFFLLLSPTGLQANVWKYAQNISVEAKNAPLDRVLQMIEKQSGFTFVYNDKVLKMAKRVTIKVKNMPLQEVLSEVFRGQPLTWKIIDKVIVVKELAEKKITAATGEVSSGYPFLAVEGVVTDESGTPLTGVSVMVKGKSKGTRTNHRGEFALIGVNSGEVLVLTSVGYEKKEVAIDDETKLRIQMKIAVGSLDEVQVMAYGVTSERLSTGNISSVKERDIEKQPVTNPLLAMQGRVPGLFINQNTGIPGGGITVRVQGQNSILNGNDPLYVIDGIPFVSQLPSTGVGNDRILGNSGGQIGGFLFGVGNPLSLINPSDIESIEVLKDADATAIYGSRGANGVILITTKKGRAGRPGVEFNLRTGWAQVAQKTDMLNTQEYLEMRKEAFLNDGITEIPPSQYDLTFWDSTRFTDWQEDLIGGTANYHDLNIALSGSAGKSHYLISGTYHRETSVFPGDFRDQKSSVQFNIGNEEPGQKFRYRVSANYMVDDNELPSFDLTQSALLAEPNAPPLYNADGTLNWELNPAGTVTYLNPLRFTKETYNYRTNNLISSLFAGYSLLNNLTLQGNFGYTYTQTDEFSATPTAAIRPDRRNSTQRSASFGDRTITSWIAEPQLNFKPGGRWGVLDILAGASFQVIETHAASIVGFGHTSDHALKDLAAAPNLRVNESLESEYKYNAVFARIGYNLRNKYIINLSGRRDGSSRFGSDNKFHNFGAIGGAWIFSEENAIRKNLPFLSFGKLRASYGTTGSDQLGDYTYLNLYNVLFSDLSYQGVPGLYVSNLYNPQLQWEETRKFQAGLDLGFLQDRILISATFSENESSNQILDYRLPLTTGFNGIKNNFPATVTNRIWELSLSTVNVESNSFTWRTNVNVTIPENELTEFPNLESTTYASQLVVGQPLSVIRLYPFLGVDTQTGIYIIRDASGNPTSTPAYPEDAVVFEHTAPTLFGGFQNSLEIFGFQLDFLFQFVQQKGLNPRFWNGGATPGRFLNGRSNQLDDVLDRWQKPGDVTSIQKFSTQFDFNVFNATGSNEGIIDASYIRLKNLSLGWQLPERWRQWMRFKSFRLYGQGQNLLTITDYPGLDPETGSLAVLPPLRVITFGIQAGL